MKLVLYRWYSKLSGFFPSLSTELLVRMDFSQMIGVGCIIQESLQVTLKFMLLCGLGKVMIRVVSLTAPAPFLSGRAMKTELHKIQRGSELRGWHAQRHGSSCLSHVTLPSASLHWPLLIHILCNELFSISFPCIL